MEALSVVIIEMDTRTFCKRAQGNTAHKGGEGVEFDLRTPRVCKTGKNSFRLGTHESEYLGCSNTHEICKLGEPRISLRRM